MQTSLVLQADSPIIVGHENWNIRVTPGQRKRARDVSRQLALTAGSRDYQMGIRGFGLESFDTADVNCGSENKNPSMRDMSEYYGCLRSLVVANLGD